MAERIYHDVTPPKIDMDAHEELEQLLETLHEHGVLRLVNNMVAANTGITSVLLEGAGKEGTLNVIHNLSALAMVLSTVPPERFYTLAMAFKEGADQLSERRPNKDQQPPGVSGAYKMLHDEQLWHAMGPLIEGLKAFAERLDNPVDKPVTDYTGKSTSGP